MRCQEKRAQVRHATRDPRPAAPRSSGRLQAVRRWSEEMGRLRTRHLLLELVGQEQELVPREAPDIEFAETVELTIDLLLADPRPPPDTEDEDGGPDTGVIWTRKVLEDRERTEETSHHSC